MSEHKSPGTLRGRLNVVVQQQLLPPYRIPFFNELGKLVNLTVCVANNVSIAGASTVPPDFQGETFKVRQLEEKKLFGRQYQDGLLEILGEERPDVLVAGSGYIIGHFWNLRTLAKLRSWGTRLFTWGCDGYQFRDNSEWEKFLSESFRRRVHYCYLGVRYRRNVDGFIAYAEHTANFWRYAFRIPEERTFVAENALDTSEIQHLHRALEAGEIQRHRAQFVFVGRLIESKLVDELIRAFSSAHKSTPESRLVIVGDGPARASLEQLARSLDLMDAVKFVGHVADKRALGRLLVESSCFVLPGPGGLAINEAMAAGLAIVCGRGDGTEEHLVLDGENGYYVGHGGERSMDDALSIILNDRALTVRMGERSHRLITETFTLKNMVHRYVAALRTERNR